MPILTIIEKIKSTPEKVFETVSDISNFSKAIPDITFVEYLSDSKKGVGTRFLETRIMKGKETVTELEVTEYNPSKLVRIVSDTHGTVWDTIFTVDEELDGVELKMVMDARAHKLLPKLINPLIIKMIRKEIVKDLKAVKDYCESSS